MLSTREQPKRLAEVHGKHGLAPPPTAKLCSAGLFARRRGDICDFRAAVCSRSATIRA
jgi:hypothetical protein